MQTDQAPYYLVYDNKGHTRRRGKPSVPFRYRVWLGKDLEPVCLVTMYEAKHITLGNRCAIYSAIQDMLHWRGSLTYFECVLDVGRIITEVHFPKRDELGTPYPEVRSLTALEYLIEQRVHAF